MQKECGLFSGNISAAMEVLMVILWLYLLPLLYCELNAYKTIKHSYWYPLDFSQHLGV